MIRAYAALVRRVFCGKLETDLSQSLCFARMYGELCESFIEAHDANNAYVLASRAFHHARLTLDS